MQAKSLLIKLKSTSQEFQLRQTQIQYEVQIYQFAYLSLMGKPTPSNAKGIYNSPKFQTVPSWESEEAHIWL